jgi:lipid A 3-O-deacylase
MGKEIKRKWCWTATIFAIHSAAMAHTMVDGDCDRHRVSEFQFTGENDVLVPFNASDGEYTNGLRFSWTYLNGCAPRWMGDWGERHLPHLGERLRHFVYTDSVPADYHYAVEFGHMIFTPNNIDASQLIVNDRPYAGFVYGGLSYAVTDDQGPIAARRQHQFQLLFGMVGPWSYAEQIQKFVHFVSHSAPPHGWDNQLHNEPGVQLNYTFQRRLVFGNGHLDFIPGTNFALGSLYDYAGAQALLRLGTKNMRGFPISNITLSAADADHRGDGEFEFYIYGGAEGRAVFHNIFLDGNTFVASHSVDKERYVYDLKTGASLRYSKWRLSYSFVRRSREFLPDPPGGAANHNFGSVTISWEPKF